LMHDYTAGAATEQSMIAAQFTTLFEVVWRAIWQFLDAILLADWWLGIGFLLRTDQPGLSWLSLLLAAAAAVGPQVHPGARHERCIVVPTPIEAASASAVVRLRGRGLSVKATSRGLIPSVGLLR
jgi:hypothetical protein